MTDDTSNNGNLLDAYDWKQHVKPCVGCGFCCRKARCYLGAMKHGAGDNCPELVWNGERWRCQLVLDNEELKTNPMISFDLSIGEGCCCALNTDRLKYL